MAWMAWTWPTAVVFIGIFGAIVLLAIIEWRIPGGAERVGILHLRTSRGDRLFLTLLGSAFVFFAWLGFVGIPAGLPLLFPLAGCILWGIFCFWKV